MQVPNPLTSTSEEPANPIADKYPAGPTVTRCPVAKRLMHYDLYAVTKPEAVEMGAEDESLLVSPRCYDKN
jgi:hypothetical protein